MVGSCLNAPSVRGAFLAGFPISAKFVILLSIISFLHGLGMDSDALDTFLAVHRRGGISNAAKFLHRAPRRSDDRPALQFRSFARSRLRAPPVGEAPGRLRAGSSARRPACEAARAAGGRALNRVSRDSGPPRDRGCPHLRAVSDAGAWRGGVDRS